MSSLSSRRVVDVLLVLLVAAQAAELFLTRAEVASVAVVVLMVLATGALVMRHRVPLPAVVVAVGAFAALIQLVPASLSTTFFSLLVVVGVVGSLPPVPALVGLAGALGIAFEGAWIDRYGEGIADFGMSAAIMVGAWTCGLLISRGTRAVAENARHVAEAERARRRAAEEAVAEERARMTRELHDVVAHALTVLVVQSVAAQQDLDDDSSLAQVSQRLRASEEVAREALLELRTLLGILGQEQDDGPTRTGLPGIEALVQRLVASGFPVGLAVQGEPGGWVGALDLTLYRVVQEGLTNAVKHGDGSGARVELAFGPEQVRVVIENAGVRGTAGVTGSGRGLVGLRNRVAQHGGTVEARPAGAGFRLVCELPRAPAGVPGPGSAPVGTRAP